MTRHGPFGVAVASATARMLVRPRDAESAAPGILGTLTARRVVRPVPVGLVLAIAFLTGASISAQQGGDFLPLLSDARSH